MFDAERLCFQIFRIRLNRAVRSVAACPQGAGTAAPGRDSPDQIGNVLDLSENYFYDFTFLRFDVAAL